MRIVAAGLDAVVFFESLVPGEDVAALLAVLSLTSPAVLDAIGDPTVVPERDRAYGPGAGWVMPSFSRRARPSRFSDGRFGIWYVAWDSDTAVAETVFHATQRLQETGEPSQTVALQVLTADVAGFAAVLTSLSGPLGAAIHDPVNYETSQSVGRHLRDRESDAIVYRSVRHPGGTCSGVLRPRAVRHCQRTGAITCSWDGIKLRPGVISVG